ncbi:MAG: protein tyrosine phosphatase family protein [Anaerolineae bacterium]
MRTSELTDILNYLPTTANLSSAGQPTVEQFAAIAAAGFEVVINLALSTSSGALPNESDLVTTHGMTYVHIPVVWENPTIQNLDDFFAAMDAHQGQKVFLHCVVNKRASAFSFLYSVLRAGIPVAEAKKMMCRIWKPDHTWQCFIDVALSEKAT